MGTGYLPCSYFLRSNLLFRVSLTTMTWTITKDSIKIEGTTSVTEVGAWNKFFNLNEALSGFSYKKLGTLGYKARHIRKHKDENND